MKRPARRATWLKRWLLGACIAMQAAGAAWAQASAGDASPGIAPPETNTFAQALDAAGGSNTPTRFNAQFLQIGDTPQDAAQFTAADLDAFSNGNVTLPGKHRIDVTVDDEHAGSHEIEFVAQPNLRGAIPCVTPALLTDIGINQEAFPALRGAARDECIDVAAKMPEASFSYDADARLLNVTIPNAMLKHVARGSIDPSEWQNGINAALFDYRVSGAKNYAGGEAGGGLDWYASLRSGVNVGPWRFRSTAMLNHAADSTRLQVQNIYASRALASIKGEVTIGDAITQNDMFDSMAFRGIQLQSDESMEPDSLRGYAPVIRGIALTHAKVELRQNGFLIYSTYVPPGPFSIDDLYETTSNADIQVTVIESDGSRRSFIQPYCNIPALLREKAWRYGVTAGVLRIPGALKSPTFVQATLAHGLKHDLTLYGGLTVAPIYQSVVLGVAKNMRYVGAFSLDVTYARSQLQDGRAEHGQSLRIMYDKSLDALGTQFRVAGYRYSTRGFHTLPDLVQPVSLDPFALTTANARDRIESNISQSLGSVGSVYLQFTEQGYWNHAGRDRVLQLGYTGSYKRIPFSLNVSLNHGADGSSSRQIALSVSLPLGKAEETSQFVTASLMSDNDGLHEGAAYSGSLLADQRLSYSLQTDHSPAGGVSGSANVNYRAGFGEFAATQTQARDRGQTSVEAAGGMVVHRHGVTFSQPLGETAALVAAPGADDVGVEANPGVHTDGAGYTVVPNLTPYRRNRITLRTADLGRQVEVQTATRIVTPKRGAIVLAPFKVSVGRMILDIKDDNGKPPPFGARVIDEDGQEVGMVGPDGQSFITGAGDHGTLRVRWSKRAGDECKLTFDVTGLRLKSDMPETDAVCTPLEPAAMPRTAHAVPQAAGPPAAPGASTNGDIP
ncbi:fimbria/pilus outer membrane usher protein [Trinickia sp. YCB016]